MRIRNHALAPPYVRACVSETSEKLLPRAARTQARLFRRSVRECTRMRQGPVVFGGAGGVHGRRWSSGDAFGADVFPERK